MSFEKTPPIWNNAGQEPSLELQENGFTAGYKPPAPYFNYLFHQNTECLKELQEKVAEKENVNAELAKRNITTYTLLHQIGITIGTETIQSLAQKIPMNSILTYSVSANYKDDTYPDYGEQDRNGVMEVIRGASTNVFFRFTRSANADKDARMWVGNWGSTTGWSGWKEVAYVTNGTLTSDNADFAEVVEWIDGNPDSEDRLGYFVCVSKTEIGITMTKATADSDVRGVTIASPAFAANASRDKYGEDGNLLNQYNYVAFAGFATVIDNGTCTVNGRCMPDDNGCAVPSSNTMGYQVIERVDDTHILILVEPNVDMLNRIKDDIEALEENKADSDHTHNYAGSSSAGGAATSANKLNTNAGSATKPVYFSDGVPKACTYELNKTVPSDAVFTDTTYSVATTEKDGLMSAEDKKQVDKIGDTDISKIGDGTATGAVSELNSNMNIKSISAKEIQIENTTDSYMILKYAQRNLLPNNFNQGTYYDVKYTKNNDGSITINGTSTGTNYGLWIGNTVLDAGTYAVGTVSNASYGLGDIFLTGVNGDTNWCTNKIFTLTSRCTIKAYIYVASGVTIDNLTIYPIILKQNYVPEEYIPYKGYDIISSNSDESKISKISITPNTTFPVTGLQSYNNLTNVKNTYGATMEVAYANNSAGKAILDGLFNNSEIIDNSMPDKWDSTKTYYTGDYCIENNKLWKCKGMNTGAEPSGSSGSTYWDKVTIASELNSKANTGYKKLLTIPKGSIDYQASTTYTLSTGKLSDYSSILLVDHNNSYSTVPLPILENGSKVNVGTGDVEVKYSSDIKIVVSISGESAGNYGLTVYGL